jgi:hypothetical protein
MQYPNRRLKNPKMIAEWAPYRFIPRRSRRRGTPHFIWIVDKPTQERVNHQGGKFYKILPGGYLFNISG